MATGIIDYSRLLYEAHASRTVFWSDARGLASPASALLGVDTVYHFVRSRGSIISYHAIICSMVSYEGCRLTRSSAIFNCSVISVDCSFWKPTSTREGRRDSTRGEGGTDEWQQLRTSDDVATASAVLHVAYLGTWYLVQYIVGRTLVRLRYWRVCTASTIHT